MKEIIKDMELDDKTFPAKYVLGAISREKDKMVSPGEMLDRAERTGDIRAQHIARAYGKYQTRLKDNNALDLTISSTSPFSFCSRTRTFCSIIGANSGTCWWTSIRTPTICSTS